MGAHSVDIQVPYEIQTREQLQVWWNDYVSRAKFEDGHSGYNGTLSTCHYGLLIEPDRVFDDRQSAADYIWENTQKWENALAVRVNVRPVSKAAIDSNPKVVASREKIRVTSIALRDVHQRVNAGLLQRPRRTCGVCGSKIHLEYWVDDASAPGGQRKVSLHHTQCPVCKAGSLLTSVERKLIEGARKKDEAALAKAKAVYEQVRSKLAAKAVLKTYWLVGGWAAD